MYMTILKILLALVIVQAMVKFGVFFIMSYAIQANPEKPWKELIVMTLLFIWVLYKLVAEAFGIS